MRMNRYVKMIFFWVFMTGVAAAMAPWGVVAVTVPRGVAGGLIDKTCRVPVRLRACSAGNPSLYSDVGCLSLGFHLSDSRGAAARWAGLFVFELISLDSCWIVLLGISGLCC